MTDTAHLPGCVASQRTQPLLDFWGKASPTNHAGIGTHSIVYHSLDVAAVGAELICRDRGRLSRIAAATEIEIATLRSALPFLLALHDIGKFARVFQAKSPANSPLALGPFRQIPPGNSHVITGFQMLVAFSDDGPVREIFERCVTGMASSDRKVLFRALAGHHGKPPDEGMRSSLVRKMYAPSAPPRLKNTLEPCTSYSGLTHCRVCRKIN